MILLVLGVIIFILLWIWWLPYARSAYKYNAPYIPLKRSVLKRVIKLAKIKPGEIFYDLGSGDGRIVMAAARQGAKAYGVEADKIKVWYSRFFIWLLNLKAEIIHQDLFHTKLDKAQIVVIYLLQKTNNKLQAKLEKELMPGTRVISVAFKIPDWTPSKIDPHGTRFGPIYLYKKK